MNAGRPRGIVIFGLNGAGKSTLGRELARILGYKYMDPEDYCFEESDIPYSRPRPRADLLRLMLADIEKYRSFVLSTVMDDLGGAITRYYELACHIAAPKELRLERVRRRNTDKFGEHVLPGGDMHEQTEDFMRFVSSRPAEPVEEWRGTLKCPVIDVDGTVDWRVNAAGIKERYIEMEIK
ncbi:MAG: AAA family ATPase [Clostridiales bacterium]|nr:AAA family ATPase [Clostridiales bacterium]